MTRQLTIILTTLIFAACQNSTTEKQLTKLEKHITKADSLTNDSKIFDQIANKIQIKRPELEKGELRLFTNDSTALIKEQSFRFYNDTTGKNKNQYYSIRLIEYESDRRAAETFLEIIEVYACCIPNEDIVRLKNFENLNHFKNSASTTLLTDNIIIKVSVGNQPDESKELSELLDEILKERKYLQLEIGHGGPAIWTIKKTPYNKKYRSFGG